MAAENPDRFKLWYTIDRWRQTWQLLFKSFSKVSSTVLDRPGEDWKYSSGFINAEMIEKALFPPSDDNLVKVLNFYKFFLLLSWNIVPKVSCCCRHVLAGADVRPTPHDQLCLQSQSGQVGLQPAPEVLLLAMGQL